MKNLLILLFASTYMACTNSTPHWKTLFLENGDDYTQTGEAIWAFENDELFGSEGSGSGYVISKEKFGDFHLKAEFFPDSIINSGIFIRCNEEAISPTSCYEFNIWDEHVNPDFRTGAVVTLAKPVAFVETVGKWNTYEIKAEGDHLQAWVNGAQTADLWDGSLSSGTIALQIFEKGAIRFRDVRIREL